MHFSYIVPAHSSDHPPDPEGADHPRQDWCRMDKSAFGSGLQCDTDQDSISWIKQYIEENYNKNLSLEVLGELVHLHPAYLSRVFKEETGKNLSAYITDVKMEKAAELLQENLRVREVMEQVGYQKSQYFSKIFKEKFGMTPKEYKNAFARSAI